MEKIAIRGDKINGCKIIGYFISLGASNEKWHWNGKSSNGYYFINDELFIDNYNVPPMDYKLYESWDGFEEKYLNKNKIKNKMEKRNIEISLEKAKEWYKQGGDLKEVALQAFSESELIDKFPSSWEEYIRTALHNDNLIEADDTIGSVGYCSFKTEEEAKAFVALGKLIQLRDEYWRLDNNWELKWGDLNPKFCIINDYTRDYSSILVFSTTTLRDKFYENFKDLIEEAKIFL